MASFLIHIGPQKTGTTYLQHAFAELAPALAQRGICYPDTWGSTHGHHRLTEQLARGEAGPLRAEFARLAADPNFDTILISSETLAYCTDEQVRLLKDVLGGAPVTLVYYFRRWSELIPAHWREVVKHGALVTFAEFALPRLSDPEASEIMNFALVLRRYAKAFGAESLRLASYNAVMASGEDLLTHFCRSFLAWPEPPGNTLGRVNPTIDMVDAELTRVLNALEWTRARNERRNLFHRFMQMKDTLPVRWIVDESMQYTVERVHIDDGVASLAQLHDKIANQYRYALVMPCPGGRLFEPRAVDVDYIQGDYLLKPGIIETLRDMQEKLLAAELAPPSASPDA